MNRIIIGLVTIFLLMGCYMKENMAMSQLNRLKQGMTMEEVIQTVGHPIATEAYLVNDTRVEFLLYRTDFNYPNESFTPVVLKDGEYVGWGDEYNSERQAARASVKPIDG